VEELIDVTDLDLDPSNLEDVGDLDDLDALVEELAEVTELGVGPWEDLDIASRLGRSNLEGVDGLDDLEVAGHLGTMACNRRCLYCRCM
jgi:hypothetical protein